MSKQSLLPFVFKGISNVVDNTDKDCTMNETDKTSNIIVKSIPGSTISSVYTVPESHLTIDELARHKRNLTMTPIDSSFSNQAPLQFNAYESINGMLHVPRFYGIEHWGTAQFDKTSNGEEMNIDTFNGTLNSIQQDACKTTIERLSGPLRGGMVVLPCGYGKTVCALYIASQMKRRTLVLVHKGFLVEQWQERQIHFCLVVL